MIVAGAIAAGVAAALLAAGLWFVARRALWTEVQLAAAPPAWLPLVAALVAAAGAYGLPASAAVCAIVAPVLCVCVATDLACGLIPDAIVYPALAIVLIARAANVTDALAGAGTSAVLYILPYAATRGRGFGLGDVKMGAVAGAALGPVGGAVAVAASFIAGAVVALVLLAARRVRRGEALPFAPFVAAGATAAYAWALR